MKTNASPLRRDAPALATFFALTLVMTNPLALNLARAVEDKQDALLNTWIIAWVGHALVIDPLALFNTNIFYPYANTLAFSETLLPQGLFALPFNLAFDNTVLGYNLVLLASYFLAAYAMYLFVFDLTRARSAAIVAGTIFAFNPYNLGNLAQVQLLSLGWLPLALMYLRRMMWQSPAGRRTLAPLLASRPLLLFALFFSLQALSSFYFAFLAGVAVATYIVWWFIANWSYPRASALIRVLISFVIIAATVVPFFLPYLQIQHDLGFQRDIKESEPFSASLKLYAEVSPQNVVYGNLLAPRPPIVVGGYPLDNLFPGLVAVALAIIGLAKSKLRELIFFFFLFVFSFLLSLGPRLYLTPTQSTDLALPYRWLYDAIPLLRALRAPVRFDALVMFALAVLAAVACAEWRVTRQNLRILNLEFRISSLLVPLIALEYLALPAAQITPIPTGNAIPAYARWLAQQPRTPILELPMLASDPNQPLDLTPQYLSTYHWQKTPDGYSGFIPPKRGEIAYEMRAFPSERALSLLQALDVQSAIVHANQFADWNARREVIGRTSDLQLVKQFGDDYIYRVAPRAPDAAPLSARLYLPNPAAPNSAFNAFLIVQNRGARSFAVKPTDELQAEWKFSPSTSQGEGLGEGRATLPLVTSSASIVPVRLTAPLRAGDYRLELRVTGAAIGEWNLAGELHVRNEDPARQAVIPARVALNAPLKAQYAAGETLTVDLTWLPLNKIDAYYSASVRVVDARGNKITAQDREPIVSTFLWTPGVPVPDKFLLTLPRDLAAGEYSVHLLMYQAEQGTEVLLLDEQSAPREVIALAAFDTK